MGIELYKSEAKDGMKLAVEQYKHNLNKVSTGRANPQLLDSIQIDYFETMTPINQLSAISVPEYNQLLVKPFDGAIVKDILAAINVSSIGCQGVDEGHQIRITFPELTTERRKEMVKSLSTYTEQAKVKIRQSRQDVNKLIKSDDELSEDEQHSFLEEIQSLTNKFTEEIDAITKEKEKELMSI